MASTSSMSTEEALPEPNISQIKNKQMRQEMYRKMKQQKKKMKIQEKKRKMKEAKATGQEVPKQVPKTIENMRVYDETMVNPEDQEVQIDEAQDEMASYFNRETTPKILLTTSDRPGQRTNKFCKELKKVIPNIHLLYRRALELKKIIPQALAKDFTDVIVINEDRRIPNGMTISHLPNGPTATFKMSSVKLTTEIKTFTCCLYFGSIGSQAHGQVFQCQCDTKQRAGGMTGHMPEVILNNFNTRLGHSVGRMLASLFPHDPQFHGRRVVTFHNQRDFIFFRHHRYIFRSAKKAGLQELGPRFTLKLRTLQKGSFDTKYGEYEFIHKLIVDQSLAAGFIPNNTRQQRASLPFKPGVLERKRHEMDTSRRKFFL